MAISNGYNDMVLQQRFESDSKRRQAARCARARHAGTEAGAIYLMDRGYIDFGRLYGLHQAGALFVTRAKSNLNAHRLFGVHRSYWR
jgi:hypothetical protein